MASALIIGVTGQDGSLLAKNLLNRGLKVHGTYRSTSGNNFWRIDEIGIRSDIDFHKYEIGDEEAISNAIQAAEPDYVFSLAGETFTAQSFEKPKQFLTINIGSVVEQLESLRRFAPESKSFFAGSAEIFGQQMVESSLDENSMFQPKTPYGVSKLTQHYLVQLYRETYKIRAFNGILFPHESSFRSPEFVTRKIVFGLVQRKYRAAAPLQLGDLSMRRDWGSADEYVDWMYRLLLTGEVGDFVFGTGKNTSVEEFLFLVASELGIELAKRESSEAAIFEYFDDKDGTVYVISDIRKYGANRFSYGAANPSKLRGVLGETGDLNLVNLVHQMVTAEVHRLPKNF
jgi:GDPmannose 4,6-dehydratase